MRINNILNKWKLKSVVNTIGCKNNSFVNVKTIYNSDQTKSGDTAYLTGNGVLTNMETYMPIGIFVEAINAKENLWKVQLNA